MQARGSHYLLFTDSIGRTCQTQEWRFVLQPTGEGERIVAADVEADADAMRLALLAVVRGLESLDGPSSVMLFVANRFVRRGIRRDLAQWRERGWRWERFGQLAPIRDLDLWRRIDRGLTIHQVECFAWSADEREGCTDRSDFRSGRFSDQSIGGNFETYPQRRQRLPTGQQLTLWGQEVFDSLAGLGQRALSRSA